jgi:hypothetical protein
MKWHIEIFECPNWLYKILKLVVDLHAIPVTKENHLEDSIENGLKNNDFSYAKWLIGKYEKEYGVTVFTVKYSTRISRMEILGK